MSKLQNGSSAADGSQEKPSASALVVSEGDRKVVTAVFADVVDSLRYTGDHDDEQFKELLDPALRLMVETIGRFGGTVMRVQGDGVLAVFGAPKAQEDHAVRACLAALQLRDAFAKGLSSRKPHRLTVRIGLHTGEAIVRSLSTGLTHDYDAVGKAVHIASRTEKLCPAGSVLVTGDVLASSGELFDVKELPPQKVLGTDEPYRFFELLARRRTRAGIGPAGLRDTPILGRGQILAQFDKHIAAMHTGQGLAVHRLEGDAGYGKTRLVREIARRAEQSGLRILATKGVSHFFDVPYLAVQALVLQLLGLGDREHVEEFESLVAEALDRIGDISKEDRIALLDMLGFPGSAPEWNELNPPERRGRLRHALIMLWRHAVDNAPCLLVLEDMHWMDRTSLEAFAALVSAGRDSPLLAVGTQRPTKQELPDRLARAPVVPIGALTFEDTCRLIELIDPSMPPALLQAIAKRSAGVPFYAQELTRDRLAKQSGAEAAGTLANGVSAAEPRLGQSGQSDIPLAIEASILARLDRLPGNVEVVARTAAVIGSTCEWEILHRACALADTEVVFAIDQLVDAGLVRREDTPEQSQISFHHEITRDVLLRTIVRSRRRSLNEAVLRVMQEKWGGDPKDARHVHALAHHAEAAQQWAEAVEYLTQACRHAVHNSSVAEAVRLYDRARDAISHLEGHDYRTKEFDLNLIVFQAYLTLGEIARMSETLAAAADLARALKDDRKLILATAQLATAQWLHGDQSAAIESSQFVLDRAKHTKFLPAQISAKFTIANALHCRGELDAAIAAHQEIVRTLEDLGLEHARLGWAGIPSVMSRAFLTWFLIERGRYPEALEQIERGCTVGDAVQQPYSQVLIHAGSGLYHLRRGYPEKAIPILGPALKLCQEAGVYTMEAIVSGWLGTALVRHGRASEALAITEDAFRRRMHLRGGYSTWFYLFKAIAEANGALGRVDDAMAWAGRAIDITQRANEILHYTQGLKCRADLHLALADTTTAIADLAQAKDLALRYHLMPLAAECDLALAEAYGRAGDAAAASRLARGAADAFRALGLERRLAEAERLSG